MPNLTSIFLVFLKVGALTIGGGYVMIPLFLDEIVRQRHWISEEEFFKLLSVAQVLPGPIAVNMAVASGFRMAGLAGSVVATLGATLPSLVSILLIAVFFKQAYDLWWVQGLFFGLRPAVAALMVAAVWKLLTRRKWNLPGLALVTCISLAVFYFKVNPAYVILGYLGALITWMFWWNWQRLSSK
ncbi:chromate transporter [Coprothermobacteraceae bacterium]|nr:chromate transporter [Coprothermobacteraceae bacterium]